MKGVVRISGLQPETIIGCYDWERSVKQRLEIDLELTADFGLAAHTDDLCHACLLYTSPSPRDNR